MSTHKLSAEKKDLPKIKETTDKNNLELYRELAGKKREDKVIPAETRENEFPQSVLEVYYQRFLS